MNFYFCTSLIYLIDARILDLQNGAQFGKSDAQNAALAQQFDGHMNFAIRLASGSHFIFFVISSLPHHRRMRYTRAAPHETRVYSATVFAAEFEE